MNGATRLAPFPYYGGKGRMLPFMLAHLPAGECFIDCFGGSAAVSLAVVGRYKRIIYNDIDDRVVNFFRVLRQHPDELIEALRMTPTARSEYESCAERSTDKVEDARRTFVRINQSFCKVGLWQASAGWRTPSAANTASPVRECENRVAMLPIIAREMASAWTIENDDFRRVLRYARADTVLFADPPYDLNARRGKAYGAEMQEQDHIDLADGMSAAPGAAVVCGYRSELYDRLYADWTRIDTEQRCHQAAGKSGGRAASMRTECLWIKESV